MRFGIGHVGRVVPAGALSVLLGAAPAIALAETEVDPAAEEPVEVELDTMGHERPGPEVAEAGTHNSFDTAQVIQLDDKVSGTKNADGTSDFYKVVSNPQDASLFVSFIIKKTEDESGAEIKCKLYDEERNVIGERSVYDKSGYRAWFRHFEVEPGTYYLEVSCTDGFPADKVYNLQMYEGYAPRPMHRLYNPYSGEHFYTSSMKERDALVEAGWSYEGEAWLAAPKSETPVYRLYNPYAGDHHYTTSVEERDMLVSVGWNDEGIGWYAADRSIRTNFIPVYRQYNPNATVGTHNYTTSTLEMESLIAAGWRDEGICWHGMND